MLPSAYAASPQAGRSRPAYAQSVLFTLALVEIARGILPPESPEVLRAIGGISWRIEARFQAATGLMQRARALGVSARAAEGLVREARDLDLQRRLEELILARVEPEWLDRYASVEGPEDLDGALLIGLPHPHPLIAALALSDRFQGLACVSPPESVETTWAARRLHRQFAAERARMRCNWITFAEAGARVVAGRPVFSTVDNLPFRQAKRGESGHLGRDAAAFFGSVRPVFVHRARDKRWRVAVGETGTLESVFEALNEHARHWPGQHLLL